MCRLSPNGPAKLPAGKTYQQAVHHMDLMPTIAAAANAALPTDRKIDGVDLTAVYIWASAASPPTAPCSGVRVTTNRFCMRGGS